MTPGTAKGRRNFSVTVETRSAIRTIWIVREVGPKGPGEPAYFATTYPDSELLSLETFKTRRRVSAFMGRGLLPGIRAAIEREERLVIDGAEKRA